jgi:hypothetical protein
MGMDGAAGLSFGGLGFGSAKPASSEPPKNVFGVGFGAAKQATVEPAKSAFGGGFGSTAAASAAGGFFGSASAQPAAAPTVGGNLFSSFNTPQKTTGKRGICNNQIVLFD